MRIVRHMFASPLVVTGGLALFTLLLHLVFNGRYGYFIDEYYYIACSEHPALGYVDHPPFSIAVLAVWRALFGDALGALRFLPALAGALTVYLTGVLARDFGGGRFAQATACLAVIVSPLFLFTRNYYSRNAFDILLWTAAACFLARIIRRPAPKWWIGLGVVLGIGLLNKLSVLWLGAGILAGLAFTEQRKLLLSWWPYLAAAIALLMFLPHVLWQIANGWPTLEFIHHARALKYQGISRLDFLWSLVMEMHPLTVPIWIAGLVTLLAGRLQRYRLIGILYLTAFAILFFSGQSKAEYLGGAFPMVLAAGGVALEAFAERRAWAAFKPAVIGLLVLGGALMAPFALPLLPVESFIAYSRFLGMQPSSAESKELAELPQHFADQFGFENVAETVARAYHNLAQEDRSQCVIIASHYGFAAAIDFYREKFDTPGAICAHNSYWLWGPGYKRGDVALVVGLPEEEVRRHFGSVTAVDTVRSQYAMPYENNVPLFLCRRPSRALQGVWPEVKHYE